MGPVQACTGGVQVRADRDGPLLVRGIDEAVQALGGALRALDPTETNDFYELIVERHRRASTIVTSNREPSEWLTMMSDALLAQSAVDRLTSGAHTIIIEGPSYRQRNQHRRRVLVDTDSEAK